MVCGDPADGHFVVAGKDLVTDLHHHRDGEALAWAYDVGPHSVDGGGRVDEECMPVIALLALIYHAKCLVEGENLGVKDLLRAEMEVATGPATG